MHGLQHDNVIYKWSIRINRCINKSISIGLINSEYLHTLDAQKQTYATYVINTPFDLWFRNIQTAEIDDLLTKSDIQNVKQRLNQDIIEIKVTFNKDQDKETIIEFFKHNNKIMSYTGIKSQYTYQLYIFMSSENDEATIIKFETICY